MHRLSTLGAVARTISSPIKPGKCPLPRAFRPAAPVVGFILASLGAFLGTRRGSLPGLLFA
jgi:hypothetical protein